MPEVPDTTLKSLDLGNNSVVKSAKFNMMMVCNFNTDLKNICDHVTNLNLDHIGLPKNRIKNFADILATNTSLRVLNFSGNKLAVGGNPLQFVNVVEALRKNTSLIEVHLGNVMDDCKEEVKQVVFAELTQLICENRILQILNLEDNDIGSDGATKLCEALKNNTTLNVLCLKDSDISPENAAELSQRSQGRMIF